MIQEAATAASYGLYSGYDKYGNSRYMIVVEGMLSEEYEAFALPMVDWAKSQNTRPTTEGSPALRKTICAEILPASGYGRNESMPAMESYGGGSYEVKDYHTEIWVPTIRR